MDLATLLAASALAIALAAAGAALFAWRHSRGRQGGQAAVAHPVAPPSSAASEAWRSALAQVEARFTRQLEITLELLHAHGRLLAALGAPAAEPATPAAVSTTAGDPAAKPPPDTVPPEAERAQGETSPLPDPGNSGQPADAASPVEISRRLEGVLHGQEFLDDVWPELLHDFFSSKRLVADFLRHRDVSEVEIRAQPPLVDGNANHWEFLIVQPRRHTPEAYGFLIPRYLTRYDPSFHRQLFSVEGAIREADTYFRKLRRCARLRPLDRLQGGIDHHQILEPGVIAVSATPAA